jgi:cell wall-associated NlpC family hydrolase
MLLAGGTESVSADMYSDDTVTETETVKDEYDATSYVLSSQAIVKGKSKTLSIEAAETTDWWYGDTIKPKNISWTVEGDAVKISSKNTNKKKLKVKAVKDGEVTVTVTYDMEYSYAIYHYTSTCTIAVSNPKFSSKTININKYGLNGGYASGYITIDGCTSYSSVTVLSASSKLDISSYYSWWDDGLVVYASGTRKGSYPVQIEVDGKKYNLTVNIFNAHFKRKSAHSVDTYMDKKWYEDETTLVLYKDKTEQLTIKGVKSGTKIKWKSSNKKVATVNQKGVVRAKGKGYCTITATFAGGSLSYEVGVASKSAVKAVYYAIKHFGSVYSQEERMSEGKYDCSSYVYRAYKDAGVTLGGSSNWAPTAADLGKWCSEKGYVLYTEDETVDVSKLRPGDLIFETGEDNGRYKGIYHVDLYVGNGYSLTVERTKYWGETMTDVIIARPCK